MRQKARLWATADWVVRAAVEVAAVEATSATSATSVGLKLNSSGTGLQYPTFDPTTQLPDTLGSGVTTPDSFFPTFDAETLNLPEFLTSQTGYGLNPNTAGTGLRPPTRPRIGDDGECARADVGRS